MTLELKNVGMIKEANVQIDGLTVIAGENDTGKSTVGKILYTIIKSSHMKTPINISMIKYNEFYNKNRFALNVRFYLDNVFKDNIGNKNIYIQLNINDFDSFIVSLPSGLGGNDKKYTAPEKEIEKDIIFTETPLIWNVSDFFRDIAQIESQYKIELDYPYLMKDLNFKLYIKSAFNGLDIKDRVISLMGGEFKRDEMGRYYFDKNGERIELVNTATGIKQFGLFQILSQNNYLNIDTILVLDEPEVHLHPKWQLEMAKIIVELVKNGVKVLVNSHSPYMIEALKRYSEVEEIEDKTNFYLAEDGYIKQENDSNSETLEKIFEKLSEPFDTFEEMDMERLING